MSCDFCDLEHDDIKKRIIHKGSYSCSLVPKHSFRKNHILVIPFRHVTEVAQLNSEESAEIMNEIGRLAQKVDSGFGSGVMQKHQPLQAENGIKVNHLHFHIFPRLQDEQDLFPVPKPNSFDGMHITEPNEIERIKDSYSFANTLLKGEEL